MASLRSPSAHPATLRATSVSGPGHCKGAGGEGTSSPPAPGSSWTDTSRWVESQRPSSATAQAPTGGPGAPHCHGSLSCCPHPRPLPAQAVQGTEKRQL
ncbi:hypothetical protein PAL_GLEAN10024659 [Pteropus alecto]|uniref:Uncharacterized protein n=1 Tax=Pteropus alecto TaxID=9402 RepID=L5JZ80_PTEAL|nr:hypothetical protein PAL_GLEAN10024659 [Pteropus alecto]